MQHLYKSIAVLLFSTCVSVSAYAQYKPMNIHASKGADKGMMGGMGMSEEMKDKKARKKQVYILKRDELSDQIRDERNAAKKQVLMDEQLQLIKEHDEMKRAMKMKMMKKMMMKKQNKSMMDSSSMKM